MELQTILAIAIPVIGFLAFLSGYFYGKSDAIKKCRNDKYASNNEIYQIVLLIILKFGLKIT